MDRLASYRNSEVGFVLQDFGLLLRETVIEDEPTGALDSKTSDEIMSLLEKLNKDGKTVIIVTHDLAIAKRCGRVIEIVEGENV